MKRLVAVGAIIGILLGLNAIASAADKEKVLVYTSMKESMLRSLQDAFVKRYPNIEFDYYSAGGGKIMAKMAAEHESGSLVADVVFLTDIDNILQLKEMGVLEPYISVEIKHIVSTVNDPEGYFTPTRLATMPIAYNTKLVTEPPKSWQDLLDPRFKDGFAIANPALSSTAYVSVCMLVNTFGWDYIKQLRANGAKMGQGSGQVSDDTASGDIKACIGVDYHCVDKIKKGANLAIVFPKEMIVVPGAAAILKGTKNLPAAKKFIDFLASQEGQSIIAGTGTLPMRKDVEVPQGFGLVSTDEAVVRAMKVDFVEMNKEKEATIQKFTEIMQAK